VKWTEPVAFTCSSRDPVAVPVTFVVIVVESGCAGMSPPGPARTVNVAPDIGIELAETATAAEGIVTIKRSAAAARALKMIPSARAGEPSDGDDRRELTLASAARRGAPSFSVGSSSSRSSEPSVA
jgi:hypothetical protein